MSDVCIRNSLSISFLSSSWFARKRREEEKPGSDLTVITLHWPLEHERKGVSMTTFSWRQELLYSRREEKRRRTRLEIRGCEGEWLIKSIILPSLMMQRSMCTNFVRSRLQSSSRSLTLVQLIILISIIIITLYLLLPLLLELLMPAASILRYLYEGIHSDWHDKFIDLFILSHAVLFFLKVWCHLFASQYSVSASSLSH